MWAYKNKQLQLVGRLALCVTIRAIPQRSLQVLLVYIPASLRTAMHKNLK